MNPWLASLLALAPGGLAWWWGRRLLSAPADEALPERLFAHRRRVGTVAVLSALALVVGAGVHSAWTLPLLVLVLLRGSYPLRKAVLQETWGFGAYASHVVRFAAGGAGFFVLLAAAPALVGAFGPASAAALLLVLVAWAAASRPVLLFLARAVPLDRPELSPHLERVVAKSRSAAPGVYRAGPRGGRMVNAFALPGLSRGAVLLTDDLIELFSPEEVAAVFAHEIAHLEHFDRRRLWLRAVAMIVLAGLAVFAVPGAASRAPSFSGWITAGWALLVLVSAAAGVAAHRGHETQSDRRALELCGDPEALVRALSKLHTLAILPRRWSVQVERSSSHPSLARRIQAIRQAADTPLAGLSAPVVLAGVDAGRYVVLEAERVHCLEGAPPALAAQPEPLRLAATGVQSFAYGDLADLHLAVGRGGVVLHARSVSGRKWRLQLRPDAVAAAQAALDVVDARLAPAASSGPLPSGSWTAALLVVAGLLSGHPLLLLPPAAVALWRPGPGPLGAAGATALAAAFLAGLRSSGEPGVRLLTLVVLGLAGLVSLVAALVLWHRAPGERGRGAGLILAVQLAVAVTSLLGLASAATLGTSLLHVHQAAARPAGAASLAGLAAVFLFRERRPGPWAALVPAALALLIASAGSGAVARRFVSDPFLAVAPPLREEAATTAPLAEHRFRGPASELRLSPSGRTFAVRTWDDEDEGRSRFRAGGEGVEAREIEAFDLRFVDDGHVLLLSNQPDARWEVTLLPLAATEPAWSVDLGGILGPQLEVAAGRWRVTGADHRAGEARVFSGALRGGLPAETRFALPKGPPGQLALGARGGVSFRPDLSRLQRGSAMLRWLPLVWGVSGSLFDTETVLLTPEGPSSLGLSATELQCVPPALDGPIFCLAYDGARTTVWEIDPESRRKEPWGAVPGRLAAWLAVDEHILATSVSLGTMLVRPGGRSYSRLPWGEGYACAAGGRTVGVLRHQAGGGTVTVFAVR
jgi:Zn-dependent protease with chaperone function